MTVEGTVKETCKNKSIMVYSQGREGDMVSSSISIYLPFLYLSFKSLCCPKIIILIKWDFFLHQGLNKIYYKDRNMLLKYNKIQVTVLRKLH